MRKRKGKPINNNDNNYVLANYTKKQDHDEAEGKREKTTRNKSTFIY